MWETFKYHFVKNIGQFSNQEKCCVAGIVVEGENIART